MYVSQRDKRGERELYGLHETYNIIDANTNTDMRERERERENEREREREREKAREGFSLCERGESRKRTLSTFTLHFSHTGICSQRVI